MNQLPKPKVVGIGKVMYRCAKCGELMEPKNAVIDWAGGGKAYHPEHLPGDERGR